MRYRTATVRESVWAVEALKGFWSLTVTGNWRLLFCYDEETNTASNIDLIDYH